MELIDVVNANGEYIRTQNRKDFLNENEYIKSVHIYLITKNHEIYIQQRAIDKEENPNLWEVVGGGVRSGENIITAAIREVKEETGILLKKNNIKHIGTLICDKYLVNAFIAFLNDCEEFTPQIEEVKNTLFLNFEGIMNLIDNDRLYSSSFGLFQKYYKENIDGEI